MIVTIPGSVPRLLVGSEENQRPAHVLTPHWISDEYNVARYPIGQRRPVASVVVVGSESSKDLLRVGPDLRVPAVLVRQRVEHGDDAVRVRPLRV